MEPDETLTAAAVADRIIAGGEATPADMLALVASAPKDELLEAAHRVTEAFKAYIFNLVMLFLWPLVFFNLNNLWLSLLIIIIALFTAVSVFFKFYSINKAAGYLYLPLVLWILFATVLNISIWWMNK